jgi:D-amino-acid dehydrogenase
MSGGRKSVLIIGGGVVGLCVAYYASLEGHEVTVIDRGTPESDRCSNGNAGMVVPSHFIPLAAPGMVRRGLRMMADAESPFYIKPRLSWDLLTWGWRFWRAANASQVARAAPVLRDLHVASAWEYRKLAVSNGNRFGLTENGLLMLCRSEEALREESEVAVRANALGIRAEVLDRSQTAAKEPDLEMDVAGSVYFPGDLHLTPQALLAVLREKLDEAGVHLEWGAEFRSWKFDRRRITSIVTSRGEFEAEEFVICAGSWSGRIARAAGIRLPMQAGKGYSLTIPNPICRPLACAILTEARVAVTPMGNSLRFGGTMEMAGLDESINPRRVAGIIQAVTEYYPQFKTSDFVGVAAWRGLRPCPPDGMPYLGRSRTWENLIVATGHGMMGISLGPITGRLVSDLLAGRSSMIDLTLLSPDRFL